MSYLFFVTSFGPITIEDFNPLVLEKTLLIVPLKDVMGTTNPKVRFFVSFCSFKYFARYTARIVLPVPGLPLTINVFPKPDLILLNIFSATAS